MNQNTKGATKAKVGRLPVAALIGVIVLAIGAACGGGDDKAQTLSAPTATPAVANAAATATSDRTTVASVPTATPTQAPRLAFDVKKALLTLEDMPAGWTTEPPRESNASKFCEQETFPTKAVDRGSAEFKKDNFTTASTGVGLWGTGEAKKALDNVRTLLETCREWTQTDEKGEKSTFKVSPLSFAKYGDQTLAFRLTINAGIVSAQADAVYIRRGDAITYVSYISAGFGGGRADPELLEKLAKAADEKLAVAQK